MAASNRGQRTPYHLPAPTMPAIGVPEPAPETQDPTQAINALTPPAPAVRGIRKSTPVAGRPAAIRGVPGIGGSGEAKGLQNDYSYGFAPEVTGLAHRAMEGQDYSVVDLGVAAAKKYRDKALTGLALGYSPSTIMDATPQMVGSVASALPATIMSGIVRRQFRNDMAEHRMSRDMQNTYDKLNAGLISDDEAKLEYRGYIDKHGGKYGANSDVVGDFSPESTVSGRLSPLEIGNPGAYGGESGTNSVTVSDRFSSLGMGYPGAHGGRTSPGGVSDRLSDRGIGNPGAYGGSSTPSPTYSGNRQGTGSGGQGLRSGSAG